MKNGLKVFLVMFTIIAIIIAIFATSIITINNRQYFDVKYNNFNVRIGDGVTYYYITDNGYNFALRSKADGTGTLHLNANGQAVGSVPVQSVRTDDKLHFLIENDGLNVMKIVDLVNNHLQLTFPNVPSFDFSGGFWSDLVEIVTGIFDLIYYPFEITVYIINTTVGAFKLVGGGFSL